MKKFGELEKILNYAGDKSSIDSYAASDALWEESTKALGKGAGIGAEAKKSEIDLVEETLLDSGKNIIIGLAIALCVVFIAFVVAMILLWRTKDKKKEAGIEAKVDAVPNLLVNGQVIDTELNEQINTANQEKAELQNQINTANQKAEALTAQMKQANQEKAELQQEANTANRKAEELQQEANTANKKAEALTAQMKQANQEKAELQQEANTANQKIEELQQEANTANKKAEALTAQMKQANQEKAELQNQINTANQKAEALTAQMKQANQEKAELQNQINTANQRAEELQNKLERVDQQATNLIQENERLRNEEKDLQQKNDQILREKMNLLKQNEQIIKEKSDLLKEMNEANQEIERLRKQVNLGKKENESEVNVNVVTEQITPIELNSAVNQKVEELKKQMGRENEEHEALQQNLHEQIGALEQKAKELQNRIDEANKKAEELTTQIKQANQKIEKLQQKANTANKKAEALTAQMKQADQEKAELQQEANTANRKAEELQQEANTANKKAEALTAQMKQADQEKAELQNQVGAANQKAENLLQENEQILKAKEDLQQEKDQIFEENAKLLEQIEQMNRNFEELQAQQNEDVQEEGTLLGEINTFLEQRKQKLQQKLNLTSQKCNELSQQLSDKTQATEQKRDALVEEIERIEALLLKIEQNRENMQEEDVYEEDTHEEMYEDTHEEATHYEETLLGEVEMFLEQIGQKLQRKLDLTSQKCNELSQQLSDKTQATEHDEHALTEEIDQTEEMSKIKQKIDALVEEIEQIERLLFEIEQNREATPEEEDMQEEATPEEEDMQEEDMQEEVDFDWHEIGKSVLCALSMATHWEAFEKAKEGTKEKRTALYQAMSELWLLRIFDVNLNLKKVSFLHRSQKSLLREMNDFKKSYQNLGRKFFKSDELSTLIENFRWVSDAYRAMFIKAWFETLNNESSKEEKNIDLLFNVPTELFAIDCTNLRTWRAMVRLKGLENEETTLQEKERALEIIYKCAKYAVSCNNLAKVMVSYTVAFRTYMWLIDDNERDEEKIEQLRMFVKFLDLNPLENFEVSVDIAQKLNDKIKQLLLLFEQDQQPQSDELTGHLVEIQSDLEEFILIFANSFVDNIRNQISLNSSDNIENTLAQWSNDEIEELGEKLYKMSCDKMYYLNEEGTESFALLTNHLSDFSAHPICHELCEVLSDFGDSYDKIVSEYLNASDVSNDADIEPNINIDDMRKIISNFYNKLNKLQVSISDFTKTREVENSQQQAGPRASEKTDLTNFEPFIPESVNANAGIAAHT